MKFYSPALHLVSSVPGPFQGEAPAAKSRSKRSPETLPGLSGKYPATWCVKEAFTAGCFLESPHSLHVPSAASCIAYSEEAASVSLKAQL